MYSDSFAAKPWLRTLRTRSASVLGSVMVFGVNCSHGPEAMNFATSSEGSPARNTWALEVQCNGAFWPAWNCSVNGDGPMTLAMYSTSPEDMSARPHVSPVF